MPDMSAKERLLGKEGIRIHAKAMTLPHEDFVNLIENFEYNELRGPERFAAIEIEVDKLLNK